MQTCKDRHKEKVYLEKGEIRLLILLFPQRKTLLLLWPNAVATCQVVYENGNHFNLPR